MAASHAGNDIGLPMTMATFKETNPFAVKFVGPKRRQVYILGHQPKSLGWTAQRSETAPLEASSGRRVRSRPRNCESNHHNRKRTLQRMTADVVRAESPLRRQSCCFESRDSRSSLD